MSSRLQNGHKWYQKEHFPHFFLTWTLRNINIYFYQHYLLGFSYLSMLCKFNEKLPEFVLSTRVWFLKFHCSFCSCSLVIIICCNKKHIYSSLLLFVTSKPTCSSSSSCVLHSVRSCNIFEYLSTLIVWCQVYKPTSSPSLLAKTPLILPLSKSTWNIP